MFRRSRCWLEFMLQASLLLLTCCGTGTADVCLQNDIPETPDSLSLLQNTLELRTVGKPLQMHKQTQAHDITGLSLAEDVALHASVSSTQRMLVIWPFVMLAVVLIALYVGLTSQDDNIADELLTPASNLKEQLCSAYMKMFLTHRNKEFGRVSEHAFRGACMFGLYAFPFFAPPGLLPSIDHLIDMGVYSNFIGQLMLFNFQTTVGETVDTAVQIAGGTFLAVLNIWLMLGFYPHGVMGDTTGQIAKIGLLWGGTFTVCMLYLKMPLKVTIFALLRFSEYWMAFLNPTLDVGLTYSTGFHVKFGGTAMKALVATLVGSTLALTACLFPFPKLSLSAAEEECYTAMGLTKQGWLTFYDFMKQPLKRGDMMNKMQRELFMIKAAIDRCERHIQSAWWECFGIGSRQRKRGRVSAMNQSALEMYTGLLGAVRCCTADDTFAENHDDLMGRLEVVSTLLERTGETLYAAARCTHDPQPDRLHRSVRRTREAIGSLTKSFHEAKEQLSLPHVHQELLEENVLCRCVSRFATVSCDLATILVKETEGGQIMKTKYNGPAFFSAFSPEAISEWNHIRTSTRLLVTYAIVFAIGYYGKQDIISPYTFNIPCTFALLISPGSGLQLTKNMMRLQGVVLGTALGLLIHAFVATCDLSSCIGSVAAIMIWIWLNLLGHFQKRDYSYLCFLMALFGQTEMVTRCSDAGYDPAHADFKIVFNIIAAISVMTAVDLLTPQRFASQQAAEIIDKTWSKLTQLVGQILDPKCSLKAQSDEIMDLITEAYALGNEAYNEPRFWKTPWRHHSYDQCLSTIRLMRVSILSLEDCLESPEKASPRDEAFQALLRLQSLKIIVKKVQLKMEDQQDLMRIFCHEHSSKVPELETATSKVMNTGMAEAIAAFAAEASKQDLGCDKGKSLDMDPAVRVCHLVACFDSMRAAMETFQSTLVFNG